MELNILYEDNDLVVCEKPIGVLSQADAEGKGSDMPTLLNDYFVKKGEKSKAYVLHRLDAGVGGVMVFAKHQKSAAFLSTQIQEGTLHKEYFAVCEGDVAASMGDKGTLVDFLFRDAKKNKSYVTNRQRRGVKRAELSYCVLGTKAYEGGVLSLVRVMLVTGRTHQIRAQFSSRRHPLVGDIRYGSRVKSKEIALFSAHLDFSHPTTKKTESFDLPLPQGAVWALFSKEDE